MNILVIAPHPDDEAIGVGGTINKHTKSGDEVVVIFLSSGEKGAGEDSPPGLADRREHEAEDSCRILGVQTWGFLRQTDGAINTAVSEDVVEFIDDLPGDVYPQAWKPDRVYAPSALETHPDHIAGAVVGEAVAGHFKCPVLYYEIWTPFQRFDAVVDITEEMAVKLEAIRAHVSQCERMDFDKAALGLARYRGTLHNRPKGPYAECFQR